MLCCGVLTLFAATILGLRRWLRRLPRAVLVVGSAVVLASPAVALSFARPADRLDRADVIERAMQSLCGGR